MKQQFFHIGRSFPAIRSTPPVDPRAAHRASLIAAVGVCVLPVVIGIFVLAVVTILKLKPESDLTIGLSFLAVVLLVTPIFSVWATLPAYFMSRAVISAGFAGWLVAMFGGAVVSAVVFSSAVLLGFSMQGHPIVFGGVSGTIFGLMFWLVARFSTPAAFIGSNQRMDEE